MINSHNDENQYIDLTNDEENDTVHYINEFEEYFKITEKMKKIKETLFWTGLSFSFMFDKYNSKKYCIVVTDKNYEIVYANSAFFNRLILYS
jgi:hypothetical protein